MPVLLHERAGKMLDEGIFYETEEITKIEFEYKVGDSLKLHLVVSNENAEFRANEAKPVSIQKIKVQPNEVIISSMFGIHPIGHLSAVGSYNVPSGIIDEERIVDFGMFHAAMDGKISRDEVIGAVILLPVKKP
jgi:hypothetical protein